MPVTAQLNVLGSLGAGVSTGVVVGALLGQPAPFTQCGLPVLLYTMCAAPEQEFDVQELVPLM